MAGDIVPLNCSSRRESAPTSSNFRRSGSTSAATKFMGSFDLQHGTRIEAESWLVRTFHGLRWQAARDTALVHSIVFAYANPLACPKAPSPLRSAGAVQNLAVKNAGEMLDAYLKAAREAGWSVPEPSGRLAFA